MRIAIILGMVGLLTMAFTPAYRLYIHNHGDVAYTVRLKNEDSGWSKTETIGAGNCVKIYRIEPGNYSIRATKVGYHVDQYVSFEVDDDDWCIDITSVTGKIESCNRFYCD